MVLLGLAAGGLAQMTVESLALMKARYLVSEKEYTEAVNLIESFRYSGSDRQWAALTLGKALSGLKRFDEANQWLMQVDGPLKAEASYCLAKNWLGLNEPSKALQFLELHLADKNHYPEKTIKRDADFTPLENNREWIHLWQQDWYTAAEQNIAECNYQMSKGQLEEAGKLADMNLNNSAVDAAALFVKARISYEQKNYRAAADLLDKAWRQASENIPLKDEMLHFALESGLSDQVMEMTGDLIRRDPSNPEYMIARALVKIINGKEAMAAAEIENVERSGIAPAELYYQAGRKLTVIEPQTAEQYFSRAIDSGKLDARYYYGRGMARDELGKTGAALDDLATSLDINPVQPHLYMDRARLRQEGGDIDGACHDWRKALELGHAKAADQVYKYCREK